MRIDLPNRTTVFFLAGFLAFSPALAAGAESNMSLCPPAYRTQSIFYRQLQKLKSDSAVEKAKVLYLIDLVKHSPHTFVRNGEAHPADKAAQHLKMKYGYAMGRVKTVEDFIDGIASQSSQTGKKYTIRMADGQERLARDLFYEELRILNESLIPRSSSA